MTHRSVPSKELVHVLLQPGKELWISYETVLHNFRESRCKLPFRQGAERFHIYLHNSGLVEGANHVLPQRVVHACLAPH